jgi:hypothetical protein
VADQLVRATWGLVVATGLLVVATLIPFVGDILARRDRRLRLASQVVPDLNILKSRVRDATERMTEIVEPSQEDLNFYIQSCRRDLELLDPLIGIRDVNLTAMNELFILRHLLTFARDDLQGIHQFLGTDDPKSVRARDETWRRICRRYAASQLTIAAIESSLSRRLRNIGGEDFWTRLRRVSDEREAQAAASIAAQLTEKRTN